MQTAENTTYEIGTRRINGIEHYTLQEMATSVRVHGWRPDNITVLAVFAFAFSDGWFEFFKLNRTQYVTYNGITYAVEIVNGWPTSATRI